jgi:chromate transporter
MEVSLIELFFIFFYVGLFTIGGGLVAITLMEETIVSRGLISPEQFYNMVAISESTPGPIGVNMATYIGYNLHGISGAIITSIGEILPSLICILIIAKFLKSFQQKPIVQSVFSVLRPATTGLIFVAAVQIFLIALVNVPSDFSVFKEVSGWTNLFNWKSLYFYVIAVFVLFKIKVHPILLLAAGAVFGILFL